MTNTTDYENFDVDKSGMKNHTGMEITEGLFLECQYNPVAPYTLKEEDYKYKGKLYVSIKQLYLAHVVSPQDGEYEFAKRYFLNWKHWQRICRNKKLAKEIDEWRDELECKLRSEGISLSIETAKAGSYQAAKWLAEGNFMRKAAGRPSKAQVENNIAKDKKLYDEYSDDIKQLNTH